MDPLHEQALDITRRQFFGRGAQGLGTAALASLLQDDARGAGSTPQVTKLPHFAPRARTARGAGSTERATGLPHFAPRARRVIYLFMSGAPSQMDMWDPKPGLADWYDKDLPDSIIRGQRFTTMTSGQKRFPVAPSIYRFDRHGQAGTWVSELLPHTASVVDDLCVIRSMHTDAINHDPGITFLQTGHEQPGRPSMGAWISYGLGSPNKDLPAFVVLHSTWTGRQDAQALYSRLWGTGFIPSEHQGVALRAKGDPVLYLSDPAGLDREGRRRMLDGLAELNEQRFQEVGDPEIRARIAQYEMAYRMQASVPELTDFSDEPQHVLDLYGPDVNKKGTFASSCLLARRLAERDVRFVQIFIRGWDQHGNLPKDITNQCRDTDQPCAALIKDLKQRGLFEDTLVVWGSEFGRTTYCQGKLTKTNYGRDHHPRCFTVWMAGGGVRGGMNYGATDEFSYNIVDKPVHVHDLNATIFHLLGIDHTRLTYRFQGRDFRLTDQFGHVVTDLLA